MNNQGKPVNSHISPNIDEWPIYKLSKTRNQFVQEIIENLKQDYQKYSIEEIEEELSRTIYLELKRIKEEPFKVDPRGEEKFYLKLRKSLGELAQKEEKDIEEYRALLNRILHRFSEEIVGSFNKRTFKFARKALTLLFKWLLISFKGKKRSGVWGSRYQLYQKLNVRGPLEKIRELAKDHTIVLLPTHSSNLDSILVGYAIDSVMGLPAFMYGAGLNLYDMEIVAYFMNRLGAFKVDRRKKNPIYHKALKKMSFLSLKKGVHTLFFPGGTRSRSGEIENNLKLGLLSTIINAQRSIYENDKNSKIIVVPLVIGYHSVLEGKYLIEQHLSKTGQELYFGSKDRGKSYLNIFQFLWNVVTTGSEIHLSLGQPLDVFGYVVNSKGESIDNRSKVIDIKEYFMLDGEVGENDQRENVYTRRLAEKIVDSYHRNNTVLESNLVAFIAFHYIQELHDDQNIFTLVNSDIDKIEISFTLFVERVKALKIILIEMQHKGLLSVSNFIVENKEEEIIKNGIKFIGGYHNQKPLRIIQNGNIVTDDLKLLYYYSNRLEFYDLPNRLSTFFKLNNNKVKA